MGKEEKSKQTDRKAHKKTAFYLRKGQKKKTGTKLALCLAFWRLFAIYWMGEMGGQSVERHPSAP